MKQVWKYVLQVARVVGHVQAAILLTLFYFVVLAPVALLSQLMSDPLHLRRSSSGSPWRSRIQPADWRAWAKAQF